VSKVYRNQPVTRLELEKLLALAMAEEDDFFSCQRNDHLIAPYRDRLLCIALCQGAALQYADCGYGVADFDIHFFYAQNPAKRRLSRAVPRIIADVGSFDSIPVDFVRTVVPHATPSSETGVIVGQLHAFLRETPTRNAVHLAQKAVVGLSPAALFGEVLWPLL